jgi:hypothetical protein
MGIRAYGQVHCPIQAGVLDRCTGPVYWSEPLEICHTVTTPTVVG